MMSKDACILHIATDLKQLGILPGDSILVHSAFKALGSVPGGPESVIQGLLRAISPHGTLLMPALNWNLTPPEPFNIRMTPSIVGAISEYFRTRPGTQRSMHPTHSICALGPRAQELLDDHWRDTTPCGPQSPLHKLLESHGKIIMLGCGLEPNTSMHALEEYVEPVYLYGPHCVYSLIDQQGKSYQKEYRNHGFEQHEQRYDRVAQLEQPSFLRTGMVLQAKTHVLDMPQLKTAVLAKLREDALFFVDKKRNDRG